MTEDHPIITSIDIVFAELKKRDMLIADIAERLEGLQKQIPKALRRRLITGFWVGTAVTLIIGSLI